MIKTKQKKKSQPKNLKTKNIIKKITKKEPKIKPINKSNSNSINSSLNKSNKSSKNTKSKKKSKDSSKSKEDSKKEKQITIDNDLIKKQYKIIKDFLTPILKEENARQLVSCYKKKIAKSKNPLSRRNRHSSLNSRAILDYSFVNENSKSKIKIPLFQILFPNQYKKHLEKIHNEKNNNNPINRPCRNLSIPNNDISNNIKQSKKLDKSKNINSNSKQNIKKNNINTKSVNIDKNNNPINNTKMFRSKTPPLYLRINDIQKKHNEEIEKLKRKYKKDYKNNSSSNFTASENESNKSRNKTHSTIDFEKWYNFEKTWQEMKNLKLNIIKNEIEENKMYMNKKNKKEETFKPKINKNSEILVNKKYDGDFYLRLKNYQQDREIKRKMLHKKLEPSFKPYVNTNYQIKSEYYDYMKFDQKLINRDLNFFLE